MICTTSLGPYEIDVKGGSSYDQRVLLLLLTHSSLLVMLALKTKMSYADSQNQHLHTFLTTASSSGDTSSTVYQEEGQIAISDSEFGHFARECTGKQLDSKARSDHEGKMRKKFVKAVEMHAVYHLYRNISCPPSNKPDFDDTQSIRLEDHCFVAFVSSVKSSSSKTNEALSLCSIQIDFKTVAYFAAGSKGNRPARLYLQDKGHSYWLAVNHQWYMMREDGGTAVKAPLTSCSF
ncbi:hypothetical protein Tco_0767495 [Tanacetum coccineum]